MTLPEINNSLVSDLQEFGKYIHFNKKDNPINSFNTDKFFYIIFSGKIKTYALNFETNREQTISILSKGDLFDVIVLLDGKSHDILTAVLEEGSAMEIPIQKVREWLINNDSFKSYLYPYLSKQLRNIEELASDISLLDTFERLDKIIMKDLELSGDLLKGLSNTEIANLVGTVRHIVERYLKKNNIKKHKKMLK